MRRLNGGARGAGHETVLLHTSDLHLSHENALGMPEDNLVLLRQVLTTARECEADVILLAGDSFDHNRMPDAFFGEVASVLSDADVPVVILPGNHDPLIPSSVYYRGGLCDVIDIHILGLATRGIDSVIFPGLDLEICGTAHTDYADMAPLNQVRERSTRWQVVTAHGHVEAAPVHSSRFRPSWLITPDQIEATRADYVALGHWNRHACVSTQTVAAFYSGSPTYTGTVNVVRFGLDTGVCVTRRDCAAATPV
jgi:DNA repair exonuclease SbcCD nuclease subunit